MRLLSFDIEDRMRSIGYYQMAGGLYGLYGVIQLFVHESTLGGLIFIFYLLSFSLFGFSVYCGNLLRQANIKGLKLSLWNQILQVIQFSISIIAFGYFSGIRFSVGFDWTENFVPDFVLSLSGFAIRYKPSDMADFYIMINIVPLIVIYLLDKIDDKIEERKK